MFVISFALLLSNHFIHYKFSIECAAENFWKSVNILFWRRYNMDKS